MVNTKPLWESCYVPPLIVQSPEKLIHRNQKEGRPNEYYTVEIHHPETETGPEKIRQKKKTVSGPELMIGPRSEIESEKRSVI